MDEEEFRAYIKFIGPENDDGSVSIRKAGKTLLALDRWTDKYLKEFASNERGISINIRDVKKNCSELELVFKAAEVAIGVGATTGVIAVAWKQLGFAEFCKQFMGTLGQQLVLKKVLKNDKPASVSEPYLDSGTNRVLVDIETKDGETITVPQKQVEVHRKTSGYLNGFNTLEEGVNTEMRVGYYDKDMHANDVAALKPSDKMYFYDPASDENLNKRIQEAYDDDKAVELTLVGRFLDFYGMATKYKFSFQARKKTKQYGKQKILCIVSDENLEAQIIDVLKPNNKHDVVINGRATTDWEGNIDKIKINWVNDDPNFNPDQLTIHYVDDEDEQENTENIV